MVMGGLGVDRVGFKQQGLVFGQQQDVVGRHGTVDDAAPVQGLERTEHRVEQRPQRRLAGRLAPQRAQLPQRAALAVQGGQVRGVVGFEHVDDPHQRGVLDVHQDARLVREGFQPARQGLGIGRRAGPDGRADPVGEPLRQVFAQHDFGAVGAVDGPVLDAQGGFREHADELKSAHRRALGQGAGVGRDGCVGWFSHGCDRA
jgi:hypothetical protein